MESHSVRPLIDQLAGLPTRFHNRDFLRTWDHTVDELRAVLAAAEALERMYRAGRSCRVFDVGLAVSNFRDQSTRTRFSYASAAALLGLSHMDLDEGKSQIAHGETVRETANMISFLAETVGIRDDIFLGEGHNYMTEVAAAVEEGHREGVLPQRPAVINLQSDEDHPTQSMADLMHLVRTFGSLEALRGRKLAMTWAYSPSYGKPLSVPQGVITLMTRFAMNVVLAHPEGYDLIAETLEVSQRHAAESGGSFTRVFSMEEAFRDADVVYPKSWAPFRVMQERTRLLRGGQGDKLKALEQEALANNAKFKAWECNEKLMALTGRGPKEMAASGGARRDSRTSGDSRTRGGGTSGGATGGKALYMHCLPADISGGSCKEGEVSADVFERYRLATYREASYKPFVIAAMMLVCRFEKPAEVLTRLIERAERRR